MNALSLIFLSGLAFILGIGYQTDARAETIAAEEQAVSADEGRAREHSDVRYQTLDERARKAETTFLPTGDLSMPLLADPKEPPSLKPALLHGGVEYHAAKPLIGRGRLVAGWDLKIDEEHEWSPNSSVKFGLQFDGSSANGRYIRILSEGYKGFTPYGQFFKDRISYAGIGVYLGFE